MLDFLLGILVICLIIFVICKIKFLRLSALTVELELLDYTGLNDLSAKSVKQYFKERKFDYDEYAYDCRQPE
jgi:hypothetical protein